MNQNQPTVVPDHTDHVLIVTIVESDFAENALKAAKAQGAGECTIIHGRGKAVGKRESIFSGPLDTSRDWVLTVVHQDKAAAVQDSIFEAVGLKTQGHGLVYQLPVTSLAGLLCGTRDVTEPEGPPGNHEKGGNG